jgi:hypothetical protein
MEEGQSCSLAPALTPCHRSSSPVRGRAASLAPFVELKLSELFSFENCLKRPLLPSVNSYAPTRLQRAIEQKRKITMPGRASGLRRRRIAQPTRVVVVNRRDVAHDVQLDHCGKPRSDGTCWPRRWRRCTTTHMSIERAARSNLQRASCGAAGSQRATRRSTTRPATSQSSLRAQRPCATPPVSSPKHRHATRARPQLRECAPRPYDEDLELGKISFSGNG